LEVGDDKDIAIKCELSEDVTFSEIALDEKRYVQFVTSVVMSTYHGVISNVRPINSYKMNTGVITDKQEEGSALAPSMQVEKRKDTTVFVNRRSERD